MERLAALISQLQSRIRHHECINAAVSKASVGWHIEHALLTLNMVIDLLGKSNPVHYKYKFDLRRSVVLLLGIIPRGKVKAPKAVQPNTNFDMHTLQQHVALSKEKLNDLRSLHAGHYFTHPFLGDFKLKNATRFLQVHTKHHLKIIDDILAAKSKTTR